MSEIVDAAILFADVAGSTRLYEQLGDQRARRSIESALDLLGSITATHDGRLIKTIGDEVMCRFPSAAAAVHAATEMQLTLRKSPPVPDVGLKIRVGLHFGPVIDIEEDVFGDAVNVAARMAGIAKADQIIVSEPAAAALPAAERSNIRKFDTAPIKGKRDEMVIFEVLWERKNVTRMVATPDGSPATQSVLLHLGCLDDKMTLDAGSTPFVLGREEGCDLVVPSDFASRQHARIEYRRGKFILVDQSTNGTFVTTGRVGEAPEEIYLRREESPLLRSGVICLGESLSREPRTRITFEAE